MISESIHSAVNQEEILKNMLKHVPFDGWTMPALKKAVVDAGFAEEDAFRVFEGNPRHALDFFFKWVNQETEEAIKGLELSALKIRERITQAILLRLQIMLPYKEAVAQTLRYLAFPPRIPLGMKYLYQAVDTIWYAIGDTSVDFNYYTKRATLAAVYSSTLIKWLNDHSADQLETQKFLEGRIDNVMLIPKIKGRFKKCLGIFR
jgi:ubiquinone biosynthesis protein COQ9